MHESLLKEAEEEGARSLRFALQPLMKGNGISEPAVAMAGVRHATARHGSAGPQRPRTPPYSASASEKSEDTKYSIRKRLS